MKGTFQRDGTALVALEGAEGFNGFSDFKEKVAKCLGVEEDDVYLTQRNGKLLNDEASLEKVLEDCAPVVYVVPRVFGGKGGFGSMLRAIGAQIEKTTNRDACRDLSGRRLRDINEEQRMKRWFAKQKEREAEKVEAKKRKLQRLKQLTEGPALPIIDDPEYNRKRSEMADSVYEAVDKGFEASQVSSSTSAEVSGNAVSSSSGSSDEASNESKDKEIESNDNLPSTSSQPSASSSTTSSTAKPATKKVFKKTMMDEDLESCSSSDDSDDEDVTPSKKAKVE